MQSLCKFKGGLGYILMPSSGISSSWSVMETVQIGNSIEKVNEFGGLNSNFKSFFVISFIMFLVISCNKPELILT